MIITSDKSLRNFEFWSGAYDNANQLTLEQLDQLESVLESMYPNGIDETELNNLMWFEFDTIKNWIGT